MENFKIIHEETFYLEEKAVVLLFSAYESPTTVFHRQPLSKFSVDEKPGAKEASNRKLIALLNEINPSEYIDLMEVYQARKPNLGYQGGSSLLFPDDKNYIEIYHDYLGDPNIAILVKSSEFTRILVALFESFLEYTKGLSSESTPSWLPEFESKFQEFQEKFEDVLEASIPEVQYQYNQ